MTVSPTDGHWAGILKRDWKYIIEELMKAESIFQFLLFIGVLILSLKCKNLNICEYYIYILYSLV